MFKKLFSVLFFLVLGGVLLFGQRQKSPAIENVTMDVRNNQVVVNYDIVNSPPGKMHQVDLLFSDKYMYGQVFPKAVSGDVGDSITGGNAKQIVWDIRSDQQVLTGNLRPTLLLDGVRPDFVQGGPVCGLLSVLVPGLGDYFVAKPSQLKFKPWMKTVSSLGLIALGTYAIDQRYQPMVKSGLIIDEFGNSTPTDGTRPGRTKYWVFPGDGEMLVSMGAVIWFGDALWAVMKGARNRKYKQELQQQKQKGHSLSFVPHPNGMVLSYKIKF